MIKPILVGEESPLATDLDGAGSNGDETQRKYTCQRDLGSRIELKSHDDWDWEQGEKNICEHVDGRVDHAESSEGPR